MLRTDQANVSLDRSVADKVISSKEATESLLLHTKDYKSVSSKRVSFSFVLLITIPSDRGMPGTWLAFTKYWLNE